MKDSVMQKPQVKRAATMYGKQVGYMPLKAGSAVGETQVLPPIQNEDPFAAPVDPYEADLFGYHQARLNNQSPNNHQSYPGGPPPAPVEECNLPVQGGVAWIGWLSLFFVVFGLAPVGVILGHVGLRDMKRYRRAGSRGWLIFTTVVSYLGSVPYVMFAFAVIASIFGW